MDAISHLCLNSDAGIISNIKFSFYDKVALYFKLFGFRDKSKKREIMKKGADIIDEEYDIIDLILSVKELKAFL